MKIYYSILLASAVFAQSLGAATYYVDFATGSDANNGTSTATPFKRSPGDTSATGTAASTTLAAGDTVKFKGGVVYTNTADISITTSGTAGNPITFDGNSAGDWGTGRAIMDGGYTANVELFLFGSGKNNITIRNFEMRYAGGYADDSTNVTSAAAGTYTNTVSTGGIAIDMHSFGNNTNVTLADLYIHDIGGWRGTIGWTLTTLSGTGIKTKNPVGLTVTNVEVTKAALGLTIYATTLASNVIVHSCNFHHYMVWCIDLAPLASSARFENITIRDTDIHDFEQYDSPNWTSHDDSPHTDGIFVRNAGSTGAFWTNVNIFNNDFYNTNLTVTTGGTASIFVSEGPSVNIYNNVFNGDFQTRQVGVEYLNTSSYKQIVYFFNNTMFSMGNPALITDIETNTAVKDVFVYNNIFMMRTGQNANATLILTDGGGSNPDRLNHNLYWVSDKSAAVKFTSKFGASYNVFADFLTFGFETNGMYADPLLVDIATSTAILSRNYRPTSSSPTILSGTNLTSLGFSTADKDGNALPSSGPWPIGAYKLVDGIRVEATISSGIPNSKVDF